MVILKSFLIILTLLLLIATLMIKDEKMKEKLIANFILLLYLIYLVLS